MITTFFRSLAALSLVATVGTAQSVEVVQRSRSGDAATQNDGAIRLFIPHLMLEGGSTRTQGIHDVWLYAVGDTKVNRFTLGAEAFVAPSSEYVSRTSLGASVGYQITPTLTTTSRYVTYGNADNSRQHLYTTGLDYTFPMITVGASIGGLTGFNTIGQVRASRSSNVDQTFVYWSNWMEVPDMPWGTWVVKEVGFTERIKLGKRFHLLVGLSQGSTAGQDYSSTTLGARYNF